MSVDPTCAVHGTKWSEHDGGRCLYCCLCFTALARETCTPNEHGQPEDVCADCRAAEPRP